MEVLKDTNIRVDFWGSDRCFLVAKNLVHSGINNLGLFNF